MREGDTPLIDAARHGRAADVAALLAEGADVNEPTTKGATPLYVASCFGHAEVVKKLLDANAEVSPPTAPAAPSPSAYRATE